MLLFLKKFIGLKVIIKVVLKSIYTFKEKVDCIARANSNFFLLACLTLPMLFHCGSQA